MNKKMYIKLFLGFIILSAMFFGVTMYYLKTNSSYSMTEYYADFDWSANPY